MLKELLTIGQTFGTQQNNATFKMKSHDRMAGSFPVWEKASTAKQQTEQRLANAINGTQTDTDSSYKLSLTSENQTKPAANETPFGFGDLFDMVNPLHHIPVLGSIYRNFSGDTIRGPGQVIGGALYGGPLGAASSMINMLVEHDTGKDITNHALNYAFSNNPSSKETETSHTSRSEKTPDIHKSILAYQKHAASSDSQPVINTTRL